MTSERWTLEEVCEKKSSNLMQKDLNLGTGEFPIYGASGLLGYVDFYQRDKEYIGIVKDGAGVGRAMLLPAKSSCIGTMQYLVPKDCISSHYLYYAVESMNLAKYNTGATIPHIYFRDYKKETLPKKGRDEQEYIASNLDKVVETIRKRRLQLQFFDDLVKSQFIEMFGAKNYRVIAIGDEFKTTSGGTPVRADIKNYENGVIPWMTSGEVSQGLIYEVKGRITEQGYNASSAKWMPINTVVVAMYGATAGQVGLLKIATTTNQAVCGIMPSEKFNPLFLYYAVKNQKEWMVAQSAGGAQPNISQSVIRKMRVPCPPKEEQNRFAHFAEQTDKSKFRIKQSLEKLEILYKALLQKYFG